ncbi:hypothetical protein [Microbacterium sp. 18062]|uniref:hypothetical protein n=1 Tax=Microbacterium sp. 18062 TaxID=2681410 RepID=UPI00135A5809|nr:hypothetical protein [Microbacterium sp. 18062]
MNDVLHLWALAPAAASACCVAADRRRVRAPELASAVGMLLAMLDSATGTVVPPAYWAGMLIAAAVVLAAHRSPRRRRRMRPAVSAVMTVHTTLGLVLMAAIMLAMAPAQPVATTAHVHGASTVVAGALVAGAAGFAAWSAIECARSHAPLERAQLGTMGLATLVMGVAVLV